MKKTLRNNMLSLFILQGSNYVISFITFPYLVRVLGPEHYGQIGLATTITQYLVLFVDFGFNLWASRRIARAGSDRQISTLYWNVMAAKFMLFLLSILIVNGIALSSSRLQDIQPLLNILLMQVLGTVLLPVWFFQGIERMKNVTLSYILARGGITVPLTFLLVKDNGDVVMAAVVQGAGMLTAGLIASWLVYRTGIIHPANVRPKRIALSLRGSLPIFMGGVAISLYSLSTPFVLGFVSDDHQVGLYVASDKLRQALIGVFLVMGSALYPRVNKLFKESRAAGFAFVRRLALIECSVTALFSLTFFALAPTITHLVLGDKFDDAVGIIRLMAPMIFLITTSVIMSNYILLPLGYAAIYARLPYFTGVLHLAYAMVLCRAFGAYGGGMAILITEILSFTVLFTLCWRKGFIQEVFRRA
ncbi:flippase [Pantoea sp. 1.19]|uniref:flippase n=1 Tax=Pantoea sp. 1.19 TaxID=1925589 RepID=UPI000948E56F|nr:flippase [Pantoea sp. 1.19]